MPTYEYRCKSCGEQLEVVQSFTDDALTVHDACGGELRKVFGSVGISFKGSGFYKNDSRGSSKSSSVATGGESSSSASESTSPSSDTKGSDAKTSDTKADTKTSDTKKKDKATPAAASKS